MLRSFELNIMLRLYIDVLSFHILISKHINVINLEKNISLGNILWNPLRPVTYDYACCALSFQENNEKLKHIFVMSQAEVSKEAYILRVIFMLSQRLV